MVPATPTEGPKEDLPTAEVTPEARLEKFKEGVSASLNVANAKPDVAPKIKTDLRELQRKSIDGSLERLDQRKLDIELSALENRLADLQTMLAAPKEEQTISGDLRTMADQVTGVAGTAYEAVRNGVMKPLAEQTKGVFLIGPIMSSLASLSPEHVKNMISRKWYEFLASTDRLSGSNTTGGFFSNMLRGTAENARMHLAILNVRDAMEKYRGEHPSAPAITLVEPTGSMQPEEKEKWRTIGSMTPETLEKKISVALKARNSVHGSAVAITCDDLLKTEADIQAEEQTKKTAAFKETIKQSDAWKKVKIETVDFSSEKTSMESGALMVNRDQLKENGEPKDGSPAAELLKAANEMPSALKIMVTKEEADTVLLDWTGLPSVTLPKKTATLLKNIEEILHELPAPERFSRLKISARDTKIENNEVRLERETETVYAKNNVAVLNGIATGQLKIKTEDASPIYVFDSSGFTPKTSFPVRST